MEKATHFNVFFSAALAAAFGLYDAILPNAASKCSLSSSHSSVRAIAKNSSNWGDERCADFSPILRLTFIIEICLR